MKALTPTVSDARQALSPHPAAPPRTALHGPRPQTARQTPQTAPSARCPRLPASRHRLHRASPLLAGLLLAGCATTPPAGPPLAHPDQPLHLTGRFSISETRPQPEPRSLHNSGRFALDRDARHLSFSLYSPFGQTIARASQQYGQPAWLETAQHQRFHGDTLEQVLTDATGITVPVSRLPHWLSDRFQHVIERSPDGRRIRAREDGWQIERHDRQWYLVQHQPGRRLEIRLVFDPTPQPAADAPAPSPADQPAILPPDGTLPNPIPRAPGRACPGGNCDGDNIIFPPLPAP